MTNKAKDIIFNHFEKMGTLVFPSEVAARYWKSEYARERKMSILSNKAISFDTFHDSFLPIETRTESNPWTRLLFVNEFIKNKGNNLKYYYNNDFPESLDRLETYLVSVLPELYSLEILDKIKINRLKDDITLIKNSYKEFLDRNNLYEPLSLSLSEDNLKKDLEKPYYIISSDTNSSFYDLYTNLNKPEWIIEVKLFQESNTPLNRYPNEKIELNDVFARISRLAKEGVNGEDIIISSPDLQRLKPYIEREAYKYNIPLSFISGVNVLDTVPGTFLKQVQNVYKNGFSFASLSALLRNKALPFRNDEGERLLQEMTMKNIFLGTKESSNVDSEEVKRISTNLSNYYKKLYYIINAINTDRGMIKLRQELHSLIVFLFGDDGFNGNETNKNIFSHIHKLLSEAVEAEVKIGNKFSNPYSSFINALEKETYVSQEKKEGIKVYSYDQDSLLASSYHFVFGLTDATCKRVEGRKNIFEDMEIEEEERQDITKNILNLYQSLSSNVYLSSSFITYSGAVLPPSYFVENDLIKNAETVDNAYLIENIELDGERTKYKPLRRQKDSFEIAKATALNRIKREEDIRSEDSRYNLEKDIVKLSFTSIEDYKLCPFKYLIKREFFVDEETTSPEISSNLAIGNILHETLEKFFNIYKELKAEELDFYKEEIVKIFFSHLDSIVGEENEPSIISKFAIKEEYPKKLKTFIDRYTSLFPNSKVIGSEIEKREKERDGYILRGKIDHVLKTQDGKIAIIDFKKGSTDKQKKSLQLIYYKMIFDTEEEEVSNLYYYGFKDDNFLQIEINEEKTEEARKTLEEVKNGIVSGIFKTNASNDNCKECDCRGICRRRFNVQ